eukprot:6193810-Pleurochrysis_carterae.AAC.4
MIEVSKNTVKPAPKAKLEAWASASTVAWAQVVTGLGATPTDRPPPPLRKSSRRKALSNALHADKLSSRSLGHAPQQEQSLLRRDERGLRRAVDREGAAAAVVGAAVCEAARCDSTHVQGANRLRESPM